MPTKVEFNADGTSLRGLLYLPDRVQDKLPAIVMNHGFSGVKEHLAHFAEAFTKTGYACLLYDHRCFGESAGEPRQDIDPWAQIRDMRHAISYAESRPEIDPQRIGIWGTSYSGAHVLAVAALDRRIKCVVSQVPMISGFLNFQRLASVEEFPALQAKLDEDRRASQRGERLAMIQICSDDPRIPHVFPGARMNYYLRHSPLAKKAPGWRNECTLRSLDRAQEYDVRPFMERISPTPLLLIVSRIDIATPVDIALAAYERALEPKKLGMVPGDHFSPYLEDFEMARDAAIQWFEDHLRTAQHRELAVA